MKRISYIDILKFFGVFFLLYEHAGNWCIFEGTYNSIKVWICSFHMPLFFVAYGMACSGKSIFLYDKGLCKSILEFITRRFSSLLVPYMIWSLLYTTDFSVVFLKGVLYGSNQSLYDAHTYQVLWFFPTFFLSTVLFQIVIELSLRFKHDHLVYLIYSFVCGSASYLLSVNRGDWGRWFGFDIAFTGVVYMIIGIYARKVFDFLLNRKKYILLCVLPVFIPLGWLIAQNNILEGFNTYIMAWAVYGDSYTMGILSASLSIFGVLSICAILRKIGFLSFLGRNSMTIICLHRLIFPFSIPFSVLHFTNDMLIPFVNTLISIIVSVPIILFFNRYCPAIVGKRYKAV